MPISFKKTRIAPTPSGFLHLGNVFSFAITAALARMSGAKLMLRIDDLDRDRADRRYVQDIFETLDFLEIPWDEGPKNMQDFERHYSQLHRMEIYRQALQQLKDSGAVFGCTCSRARLARGEHNGAYPGTCRHKSLPLDAADTAWRLRTEGTEAETSGVERWGEKVTGAEGSEAEGLGAETPEGSAAKASGLKTLSRGRVPALLPLSMQEFIVRKKDGFPAYQLSSLLDDLYYGIDLIVRGEDLWPSTLAQHYLSGSIGATGQESAAAFGDITFHHHPLLSGPGGEKLSKSAGATSVQWLRKQGKKPADIYTMIARMSGWQDTAGNWEELTYLLKSLIP